MEQVQIPERDSLTVRGFLSGLVEHIELVPSQQSGLPDTGAHGL